MGSLRVLSHGLPVTPPGSLILPCRFLSYELNTHRDLEGSYGGSSSTVKNTMNRYQAALPATMSFVIASSSAKGPPKQILSHRSQRHIQVIVLQNQEY